MDPAAYKVRVELMKIFYLLIFFFVSGWAQATVMDPTYDEFEGIDLVWALTRDGKLDQAERELKPFVNDKRYPASLGALRYAQGRFEESVQAWQVAPSSVERNLYLARSYAKLNDSAKCIENFQLTSGAWSDDVSDLVMKAACEFKTGESDSALNTLNQGIAKFHDFSIVREKISLLLELGLAQSAQAVLLEVTPRPGAGELLGAIELFQRKGLKKELLELLEFARWVYLSNEEIELTTAKVHFDQDWSESTMDAFERAARLNPTYSYPTAEVLRQMGKPLRAQYWHNRIAKKEERLRSQVAICVDKGWYAQLAATDALVSTTSLVEDPEVRYALGYSLARMQNSSRAHKYLDGLNSEKATRVRASLFGL